MRDSLKNAVDSNQHPLSVDEGVPIDVHPGSPMINVDLRLACHSHFPGAGRSTVAPNNA